MGLSGGTLRGEALRKYLLEGLDEEILLFNLRFCFCLCSSLSFDLGLDLCLGLDFSFGLEQRLESG